MSRKRSQNVAFAQSSRETTPAAFEDLKAVAYDFADQLAGQRAKELKD